MIKEIDISSIQVPDIDYENEDAKKRLEALTTSIKEKGLLHPITVFINGELFGLISGRKRLEACKRLNFKVIQALILEEEEDARLETHIHENLNRFNLPWYEQVTLESQLHLLRQKIHGKGKKGVKAGWSIRDTAEELGMSFGMLSEDLKLAEAVIIDPKLKRIDDRATAKRIIYEKLKRTQSEIEAGLDTSIDFNKVYCGNSVDILSYYPAEVFDACITDPPWSRYYRDEKLVSDETTLQVFKEVFRVLKWNSFLYAFVSTNDFYMYREELPHFGFKVQEMPIIWLKEGSLSHGTRAWEYQRNHEPIILAVKGTPALTSSMLSSVLSTNVVPPAKMIHPNEKPVQLLQTLLGHCTYEGSIILDPFSGSGSVIDAARSMSRRYVGIEKDQGYYAGILKRLEAK